MLRAQLDHFGLLHLAQVNKRSKVLGLAVLAQHISEDAFIAAMVLLMRLHDRRANIQIFWLGKRRNTPHFGERLESKFRHEPWFHLGFVPVSSGTVCVPSFTGSPPSSWCVTTMVAVGG